MDTTELQNLAIEIRDAENEGENTALRVGTMLLAIIDAFANIVDLDTLQQILEQYAGTTGTGQIYWRHARCVFLASMGAELDAVNGDGWEYTNHNGDIVFNPTSKNLRVVGETGSYFVYTNVLYVHAHTSHAYKWDAAEQKMVEVTDSNLPAVITYKNTPAFSQVAIGESYVFQSQSSGPKIAIKISSSETYSFLPDPKKIYAFRDIRQAMLWKPSNQTWVSLTPRVINDLTTGGEGDALSAEMGKVIKRNIMMLWAALGNYAFLGDKPTLDWGGGGTTTCSVTQTLGTRVVSNYQGSSVNLGDSLTVRLSSSDDLYVINPSSVKVKVGGVDMTSTYYNENTDIITIPTVVDNVVIEANAMTYVQDDLVLHLDCRHRGGTGTVVSGHWKSLVNYGQSPIDFTLKSGVTAVDTGVVFDGDTDAYGETNTALALAFAECTVEAVASGINSQFNPILVNPGEMVVGISIHTVSATGDRTATLAMSPTGIDDYQGSCAGKVGNNTTDFALSLNGDRGYNKGIPFDVNEKRNLLTDSATQTKLTLGARFRGSGNNFLNGTVRAIRVYHSVLTAEQQLQNWIVDKKRFNL